MTLPRPRAALPRLVALLAAVVLLPWAPAGAATTDELQDTRARIEATISELESVDAAADRTADEVAAAEERVAELEAALNDLLLQVETQQRAVDAARAEADASAAERDRIEQVLGDRARRAFMGGTPDPLLMLGAEGIDDVAGALDNLAVLGALAARADASIESLDVARTQADATAARLGAEVDRLEEVRSARAEVLAEAEEVLSARADVLADLEAQADRLMAQQEELEAEEAEILQLIREQEEAARRAEEARRRAAEDAAPATTDEDDDQDEAAAQEEPPPPPASPPTASGCYAWPAGGPVTSEYGPRWGRMHRGIDIDGNTGDALVAAQSGTVTFTGWYYGYGNMTLIRHSDGVTTAYAHQSSIGVRVGQTVARGEYIGRMGATGNVTGSHLHFETRQSSGAVNPRTYLC